MRITPTFGVMRGGGLSSPPEPFIEIDEAEGLALIQAGRAVNYDREVPPTAVAAEPEPDPVIEPGNDSPPGADEPALVGEPAADAVAAADEPPANTPALAEMIEAIELLSEDDFVKTGPRAGRPKVAPLAGVLGREVTAEEVDAAFDAKEAGL